MNESLDRIEDGAPDGSVSRRGFVKYGLLGFCGLATFVGVATPVVAYLWPPMEAGGTSETRVAVASVPCALLNV